MPAECGLLRVNEALTRSPVPLRQPLRFPDVTTISALWTFALVVGLLTLTPGLDTALIVRTATLRAPRRAWGVVFGIQSGTLVWGVLTSAGATALLTASRIAYETLRWAGAAYLVWIGARMLWTSARGGGPASAHGENGDVPSNDFLPGWRRGFLTNLLNPKMGAFYVALLPQFIPTGATPLTFGILLACVHVALGTAWSTVLVLAARRLRRWLTRPAPRRLLDGLAGGVIVGFGLRLAADSR
jgi:threonine/homoserine/homoserine lactone efflux protein